MELSSSVVLGGGLPVTALVYFARGLVVQWPSGKETIMTRKCEEKEKE